MTSRALTRRAALGSGLALAACGATAPGPAVSFQEADPHILLPVGIGGHSGLAILDNGAAITSVDLAFAKATGLPASSGYVSLSPTRLTIGVDQIAIHPLVRDMTEAAISADAALAAIAGQEVFDAFIVALAFAPNLLTLHSRSGFSPPREAKALPLIAAGKGPPFVEISIGGVAVRALLDLGCAAPLLVSSNFAATRGLGRGRPASTRQTVIATPDGLGLDASTLTSIDGVGFGGHIFDDVPIDILPQKQSPFDGYDVAVGLPLLRQFDLILDLPRRAWLIPSPRLTQPFIRRYTGLQTRPQGMSLLVRHVGAGSPAEAAGFQAGNLIARIDAQPPLMRTLREAKAGQVLEIELAGGARRRLLTARYY